MRYNTLTILASLALLVCSAELATAGGGSRGGCKNCNDGSNWNSYCGEGCGCKQKGCGHGIKGGGGQQKGCDSCGDACNGKCGAGGHKGWLGGGLFGKGQNGGQRVGGDCGPMPQTCYNPRYGCYAGNNRHMHRYPAFHGYYYRRPYNYRNLMDYPWHAEPHEPTSLFSYNVPPEEQPANADPGFDNGRVSTPQPPEDIEELVPPLPDEARRNPRTQARSAVHRYGQPPVRR